MLRLKRWVQTGLAMAMIAMLAACGGNGAAGGTQTPSNAGTAEQAAPTKTEAAPVQEAATRLFKDDAGHEETIPTHPQRIVVDQFMGHLLALDVKPVGAASYQFEADFLKPLADGIEDIGNPVSLEKVLALKPDLIILQMGGETSKSYAELEKIAPTIQFAYGEDQPKDVLEQLRMIGDVVGKKEEAEKWIAAYEAKGEKYREQISQAIGPDKTFTILEVWPKAISLYGKNFGRGGFNLYDTLKLSPPKKVQQDMFDKNENWMSISMETIPDYAGDYIFLTINAKDANAAREQELKGSKVWQSLPAVKGGRVFQVNTGEFYPGDPISVDKQLDIQAKLLLEAAKK